MFYKKPTHLFVLIGTLVAVSVFLYGRLETGVFFRSDSGVFNCWSAIAQGLLFGCWIPFFLSRPFLR